MRLALIDALSGTLPPGLAFGMQWDDLLPLVGPPWGTHPRSPKDQRVAIAKYGDVELYFEDDGLYMIFSDTFVDVPRGSGALEIDPGWLRAGLHIEEAERHFARAGTTWERIDDRWNPGHVELIVSPWGCLSFRVVDEPTEPLRPPGLESIKISPQGR